MTNEHIPKLNCLSHTTTSAPLAMMSETDKSAIEIFIENTIAVGNADGSMVREKSDVSKGLEANLNSKLEAAARHCGRETCSIELKLVGIASEESHLRALDISCPLMEFATQREANEADAQCRQAHWINLSQFPLWVAKQNKQVALNQTR